MENGNKESIFAKARAGQPALPAAPATAPGMNFPPPPPLPAADPRVPALQAEVAALRAELEALRAAPPPPPPPLPGGAAQPAAPRLERLEAALEELRARVGGAEDAVKAGREAAVTGEDIKNVDLKISDLAAAFDGLKRAVAGESELAARAALHESALAEVKRALGSLQEAERRAAAALAPREELEALKVSLAGALAALEENRQAAARQAEQFSSVETECRKALGEMRGYAKSAQQKPLAERFDGYMKESVTQLGAKLAEVETAMRAGLAELAGRLSANEVLYEKIFLEAEQRVREGVAPELKAMAEELKWLRENVIKMTDIYTVVTERKLRLLEGKYAAFEAIARRMDAIDEVLKAGREEGRL